MLLTYIEYYPHYMGTLRTTAQIALEDFILLTEIEAANEGDDEPLDFYSDEALKNIKRNNKLGPYAFDSFISNDCEATGDPVKMRAHVRKILKHLSTKGYWAGQWEEGSFAIALPNKTKEAAAAIARIEAQIEEDEFDF
jgi:hypothetical protein